MALSRPAINAIVTSTVFPIIASVAVALRFIARSKKKQPFGSDDWSILAALICCLSIAVVAIWAACIGLTGAQWSHFTPIQFTKLRKIQFAQILLSHVIFGLTKLSVVFFYKRIFNLGRIVIATNLALALVILFMITSFFTLLFCARGVSSFWTTPPQLEGTQYIMKLSDLIKAYSIIDIVLDITILSLPLAPIYRMHLSVGRRLAITAIFLLGAFCLVCSIVRLHYVQELDNSPTLPPEKRPRIYDNNDLWAHLEAYASTLTACLPTLRPIFPNYRSLHSLVASVRSWISASSNSSRQNNVDEEQLCENRDVIPPNNILGPAASQSD
ncbi:hypothetical protein DM02DRAFT_547368 [Periconia macrospinosa]|uniref:Rhodopsin domain-containing protein n=1 Tax=Periconia macrospinosa TaxID=97972 RepID=A0A2V1CYC4_9PLEO|nr:hypothetical protein DM02DRAFT_547368 [Periconia macrospinosa]